MSDQGIGGQLTPEILDKFFEKIKQVGYGPPYPYYDFVHFKNKSLRTSTEQKLDALDIKINPIWTSSRIDESERNFTCMPEAI